MKRPIHITAGAIGIASGFVALYAVKGAKPHRKRYSMGMAYPRCDIRLPDGARRPDHSHPVSR